MIRIIHGSLLALIVVGIVLVLLGSILVLVGSTVKNVTTSGGVVIFIGPVPVAISWGRWGPLIILISILILAVMLFLAYLMLKYKPYS